MVMEDAFPNRSIGNSLANLGNTCYMNAVLQALAHAPELCLAMDCEPHTKRCPIAAENAAKRRASPASSVDETRSVGTRKSRRSSGRKTPPDSGDEQSADETNNNNKIEYCALCEFEHHMRSVHDVTQRDKPFAPSAFVHGFIEHVAPMFKLGVQEDSHEFLRLLIDAMQQAAAKARSVENPQDDDAGDQDSEYPFTLFRGMVESNVVCASCHASSATMDPIEDIGLEVTASDTTDRPSRNSPTPHAALSDVQSALQRFAKAEAITGYKCAKCGKTGRATKQSRLAMIPPILTLHLKRFRYGDSRSMLASASSAAGRRTGRSSEVNQLLGNQGDFLGKSGSAKIEGHIKFGGVVDLRPYATPGLIAKVKSLLCRLFAVVVHAGKNSHSGHYIAYVRNLEKNEWWKMDDGRVTAVAESEVLSAEAYMLFYRVVNHPVTAALEHEKKEQQEQLERSSKRSFSEYASGHEWLRAMDLPESFCSLIDKAHAMVADEVKLTPAAMQRLENDAKATLDGTISRVCGVLAVSIGSTHSGSAACRKRRGRRRGPSLQCPGRLFLQRPRLVEAQTHQEGIRTGRGGA